MSKPPDYRNPARTFWHATFASIFAGLALGLGLFAADDPGRIVLDSAKAQIQAERLEVDRTAGTVRGLMKPADSVGWGFRVDRAGWYQVIVHYALDTKPPRSSLEWVAKVGDQSRLGPMHATGPGDRFLPQVLFDPVELEQGEHKLTLGVRGDGTGAELKIRKVELVRAREPGTR